MSRTRMDSESESRRHRHSAHEAAYAKGQVNVHSSGHEADFSVLSYTYPLKMLSPKFRSTGSLPTAVAYILTYGGGLVSGDEIELEVNIGPNAALVFLTQGSTKIFKVWPRLSANLKMAHESLPTTYQRMHVTVQDGGIILLLVDPVTCFREASYIQRQVFNLHSTASLVVLDWITAGRVSRGEDWDFSRYQSINEIFVNGRRHARDALFLEAIPEDTESSLPYRTLKDRLDPYRCYATAFLFGPLVASVAQNLVTTQAQIAQLQLKGPSELLWSISAVESGWVVRIAAVETETAREWLREALSDLSVVIGSQIYSKAFV